jgi:competence protein ComEC
MNGLTERFSPVTPEIATISVGKNQWGHPHKEVLEMLQKYGIKIYRTDKEGNIEIVSDGKIFWKE